MTRNTRVGLYALVFCALIFAGLWGLLHVIMPARDTVPETLRCALPQPKSFDPAFASDLSSGVAVLALYDTLYAYDYAVRPYRVKGSMLCAEPLLSDDRTLYTFTLRKDLYFQPFADAADSSARRVTSRDVVFSLLRLADPRLSAPGYTLIRGKIRGLETFRAACVDKPLDDFSPYDAPCSGLYALSDTQFCLHLESPDPRLPYYLAMPYSAIVSRRAAESVGLNQIDAYPCGSGPFSLLHYQRDYRMELARYADYRTEYFVGNTDAHTRTKKLPYAERIVCYLVQDLQPAYFMFLNGDLDYTSLNKNQIQLLDSQQHLPPSLREKEITLLQNPEMQINYVGFSFTDPRFANNKALRRALSFAYNRPLRQTYYGALTSPVNSPIPEGLMHDVPLRETDAVVTDIERAKEALRQAGYPDGIDPSTREPLSFTFDFSEVGPAARQNAEMAVRDFEKIGLHITPLLNSKAKFIERNRAGQMQLFYFNWVADYPDAENFFQLFYSPNAGGCNRAYYQNKAFDALYEKSVQLAPGAERDTLYRAMLEMLRDDAPWIYESTPNAFILRHKCLHNFVPGDFAFDRWKYLSIDPAQRNK